jgi:threonine aldolase
MTSTTSQQFLLASDNYARAHPQVLQAVIEANETADVSYGGDDWTARLQDVVRAQFGVHAQAYPVFNGTAANVIALRSMQPRWGAVICADVAHINTDECAAPELTGGMKLLPVPTADGKLTAELVADNVQNIGNEHHAQPSVVSLTQSTEVGTVYTQHEIVGICDAAHSRGLLVHMDGARLSNAAATLQQPLRALTTDLGVDVLSLGGTKNGLLFGEAIVVLNPDACTGLNYIRKYTMQLASKMRFISAQLTALYEGDLWYESASRANQRATLLRSLVDDVPGVYVTQATQANAVFAVLAPGIEAELRKVAMFQTWNPRTGEVRWMCSHDTTEQEVRGFADAVREAARACRADDRHAAGPRA